MSKRCGLTLYELLVAGVIVAIVTAALTRAFAVGLTFPARAEASRDREGARIRFEEKVGRLLRNAFLSTDTGNAAGYFLAGVDAAGEEGRVTFTAAPESVAGAALSATGSFEEQHERFGPIAATREVSLGLTPLGEAGDLQGLFLREQVPADGDPTQGGKESLLGQTVEEATFELYDGAVWQIDWDTRTGQRRLPAAVRVSYRLQGEEQPTLFVVQLVHSDVTPENPIVVEATP